MAPFSSTDSRMISTMPAPKMLILNFPGNPTTQCVDLAFFEKVVAICREHEISDSLLRKWRDQFLAAGVERLQGKAERIEVDELRGQVAKALRLRVAPDLTFTPDQALDYAMKIDELMHRPEVVRDLQE